MDVAACDPVSDMAVLGELDNQAWPDDAEAFEQWREQVEPVPLSKCRLEVGQSCPVFIYTHKRGSRERLPGYGRFAGSSVALFAEGIESGTSGSPVVTADGLLLGIVSHTSSHRVGEPCGGMPVANMSLPHWILARIGLIR